MLELKDITVHPKDDSGDRPMLQQVSLLFPPKHLGAIVGPSGCGKSTLLKVIAGLKESTEGGVHWQGRDLAEEKDLDPHEIGYVPQFGIAHEHLTIRESIETSLRLRVAGLRGDSIHERVESILKRVGLAEIPDRMVNVLSGGQKRRLAMAMELVSLPTLLLCDEVTSGLDPKAEEEIVDLLHDLAGERGRVVLSVTHSLRHINHYDSVTVLYEGCLAYHGPSEYLLHYFSVKNPEEIFPQLAKRSGEKWKISWLKHREAYLAIFQEIAEERAANRRKPEKPKDAEKAVMPPGGPPPIPETTEPKPPPIPAGPGILAEKPEIPPGKTEEKPKEEPRQDEHGPVRTPGFMSQWWVLLKRRCIIFFRNRSAFWLQLSLLLGFPCLVVIFALHGLPPVPNTPGEAASVNPLRLAEEVRSYAKEASRLGGMVSGLVMFQVILLTLMASNNSAREIAAERLIFEKEKLAGVRPLSYVASKATFLSLLVLPQAIWMALFVKVICRLEGDLFTQIGLLIMVNAAMTAVCLGISGMMRSPEQASLVSIYLVGFQLPLSGAVLALPEFLALITRPFIAAYWSWSGVLQTMRDTRYYDVVKSVSQTELSASGLCFWVLWCHVLFGLFLAYAGCKQSKWE